MVDRCLQTLFKRRHQQGVCGDCRSLQRHQHWVHCQPACLVAGTRDPSSQGLQLPKCTIMCTVGALSTSKKIPSLSQPTEVSTLRESPPRAQPRSLKSSFIFFTKSVIRKEMFSIFFVLKNNINNEQVKPSRCRRMNPIVLILVMLRLIAV